MYTYRVVFKDHSNTLFASGRPGRWNGDGKKVLYTGESIAIALLENMTRRKGLGFNDDFRTMYIEIPDASAVTEITLKDLPADWRSSTDYSKCQAIGNKWFDECKTLLLKVPSALLPDSYNYVINTLHPDYPKMKLLKVETLVVDKRLEDIIKGK